MSLAASLKETFHSLIQQIYEQGTSVVLFGTGRASWYMKEVLNALQITIDAVLVSKKESSDSWFGIPVLTIEEASKFKHVPVLIGIFKPESARTVSGVLQEHGFSNCYAYMKEFLYTYFTETVSREVDKEVFAHSISALFETYETEKPDFYGNTQSGLFVSPFVTGNITQKCSLKCRDCGQRIPYYKNPKTFDVNTIVSDIMAYAEAFDVVPEVSFHGGEPLLHPHIAEIAKEVSKISNIIYVTFLTNGTIAPKEQVIKALSECGASLQQSDYGSLSHKQDEVSALCERHHVYTDFVYTTGSHMWVRSAPMSKHNRSTKANDAIYRNCVSSKICCQIMDGELYRCPLAMHSAKQGLIPKDNEDFVALHPESGTAVESIRAFISAQTALPACDFCAPGESVEVLPAIQIEKEKNE